MPQNTRHAGRPVAELVWALGNEAAPGSHSHEEMKAALQAMLVERLAGAIDKHEQAASRLGLRLLWLDIALGVFTVVGTVLAVIAFVRAG